MFFTPIKLSQHRAKTPEGFLVISGCAIARTGVQLYSDNEVDVPAGPDGIIRIERDEKEVFSPTAMASAEGKDIVDDHPGRDVVPENWRMLSHGHMQNVRRGTGVEDHLLLADLIFKSPESIAMFDSNPEQELSCGYESQYEIFEPGRASQCNIRINHVAWVKQGRCGPVCATKDSAMPDNLDLWGRPTHENCSGTICTCGEKTTTKTEDHAMRVADWVQRMKDAMKSKDHAALEAAVNDAEGVMKLTGDPEHNESTTHIHVHLGGPETTKPAGDLPETGEERVSSAKDNATGSMFGEKIFFQDAEANAAFHEKIKGMEDGMEHLKKTCEDGFEEMKKHMDSMHEAAKKTMVDSKIEGEEPAHEKANREIEGELKEEAPQATGDVKKARDSVMLVDSFQQTVADAAVLVPGIAIPTFDSALAPAQGYAAICGMRKKALTQFAATDEGKAVMSAITRTTDFAGCACREVTPMFKGAVAVRKAQLANANMRSFTQDEAAKGVASTTAISNNPMTLADVQRANEQYWENQARAAE